MDRSEKTILLVVLGVLASCICVSVICGISIVGVKEIFGIKLYPTITAENQILATPMRIATIIPVTTPQPQPTMTMDATGETLSVLENAEIPTANLIFLAEKFEGRKGIPLKLESPPIQYRLGDKKDFYKLNTNTNEMTKTMAVLRYASAITYFWVEEGIYYDPSDLKRVAETFDTEIYPTNHEFFGTEWIPGVDNDPHLFILYARNLGVGLSGYHAPSDSVLPAASEYSNAHEMFAINADIQTFSDPYTMSVMAHELQHMIHAYHDPNEETWLNEGFSELATLLNGYNAGGFDSVYAYNTDIQLNDWSEDPSVNDSHYGASYLYTTYLLDRFGEEITKQVVADPLNGFKSIDHVFINNGLMDETLGKPVTADDFFADWTIANYSQNPDLGDGRYSYEIYPNAPRVNTTESIVDCSATTVNSDVMQFGVDYYEIYCPHTQVELNFKGVPTVNVLPISTGDNKFMWSNRADVSEMSLTREFDLTGVSAPVTLTYQTWYDLETDYDYVYLLASENGVDWEILQPPSCTTLDINGNNYGCAYNGQSQSWFTESVDLSRYAGRKVTLSFEYITDAAVVAEGFLLDDVAIPAIGYTSDFENDDGGWLTKGFVRIENQIPQTFLVSIISDAGNGSVQKYSLESGEELNLVLEPLESYESYIFIVSGSSRFTRQRANYQIALRIK